VEIRTSEEYLIVSAGILGLLKVSVTIVTVHWLKSYIIVDWVLIASTYCEL
jgi:hypothetical protein